MKNSTSFKQLYPKLKTLLMFLSAMLVVCSIYRVSIFPLYVGKWSVKASTWGQYGLLVCSALYLMQSQGGRIHFPSVLLVLTSFISIFTTSTQDAAIRWTGWFLLFSVAGPMVQSPRALKFRDNMWRTWRVITLPLALGSLITYVAPLPRMGRGFFAGLMRHSMLLAPISAIATVIALTVIRKIDNRKGLLMACGLFACCVVCTSRSAVLCCALAAAAAAMLDNRAKASSVFALLVICLLLGLGFQAISQSFMDTDVGRQLQHKGMRNTRARLWEARIKEFKAHPLFGIGVGMAMAADETLDEDKVKSGIEPGSSWLTFLSMTGSAGSLVYILFIITILSKFVGNWKRMPHQDRVEVTGIAIFLGLHSVFEGYALAFGSPMSMIFWLCWGRMADLAYHPELFSSPQSSSNTIRLVLKRIQPERVAHSS